jgi:hypothetical protein
MLDGFMGRIVVGNKHQTRLKFQVPRTGPSREAIIPVSIDDAMRIDKSVDFAENVPAEMQYAPIYDFPQELLQHHSRPDTPESREGVGDGDRESDSSIAEQYVHEGDMGQGRDGEEEKSESERYAGSVMPMHHNMQSSVSLPTLR